MRVPDLAMAGGFSSEDGIYKVLAMGSPHFKAVCMGRALMIPGFVGKNIGSGSRIRICQRPSPSLERLLKRSSSTTRMLRTSSEAT